MSDQIDQADRVIGFIVHENIDWHHQGKKKARKQKKDVIKAFAVVKNIGI